MIDAKLRVTVRIGTAMGTSEDVGRSILSDTEYRFESCPGYEVERTVSLRVEATIKRAYVILYFLRSHD